MNREYYKNSIYYHIDIKTSKELNKSLIDEIFNDFESRICNNCEYWHQEYLCLEIGNGTFKTERDFGCTLFKRKEILK